METVCARLLKDKIYIGGVNPKTISFYEQSFSAFRKYHKGEMSAIIKADLNNFAVGLRERSMSPNGANVYMISEREDNDLGWVVRFICTVYLSSGESEPELITFRI